MPPAYSAKKIRGEPAYKRARRGEVVVPDPVEVTIHSIDEITVDGESIRCRVHCSSGTYVRTLAHEVGERLGIPAHLAELRRTQVGAFGFDQAVGRRRTRGRHAGEPLGIRHRSRGNVPGLGYGNCE